MEKCPFLDQNHGLTPLEKCQFFDFLNFFFYSLETRFFVPEYRKTHFLAFITKQIKVGKMAIFGPKPWVNPFGKMSFFRLFELLVFIAWKAFYRSRISWKTFSWPILPQKKLEKWPFLDQNHGLTLWKNVNFSTFWTSSFYILERSFFVVEYRKRHFPGLYYLTKKKRKNGHFSTKTMG